MLRKQNDNFQENLSRPGIIDARARYRVAGRRLRNTGICGVEQEKNHFILPAIELSQIRRPVVVTIEVSRFTARFVHLTNSFFQVL
jgi:hypothetical protein